MHGIPLKCPAMQLREEITALRFRHLRFGTTVGQSTEGVEALEMRNTECGMRTVELRAWRFRAVRGVLRPIALAWLGFADTEADHALFDSLLAECLPRNEKWIAFWNSSSILRRTVFKRFRLAQEEKGLGGQIIKQVPEHRRGGR